MAKTRVLTLIEKVNIIREYLRTKQSQGLAKKFNCHRGQIHHILRHKDEYLADWLTTKDPTRTRRPRCKVLNALGLILYEWISRCSHYEFTLTDEMIKSTACEISKVLNYRLFKPNPKWYSRFKLKFRLNGITNWEEWKSSSPGEKQSLVLEDILHDLRAVHGEDTIPNYVQLNDEEFKDLTVRCYGNQNVAEQLGELLCGNADIPDVVTSSQGETTMESSNSHNGYVSYNESEVSDEGYTIISIDNDDSNDAPAKGNGKKPANGVVETEEAKPIDSYRQALNILGPLEQFALLKEDIRAVGLINQLEIIFQDRMAKEDKVTK